MNPDLSVLCDANEDVADELRVVKLVPRRGRPTEYRKVDR